MSWTKEIYDIYDLALNSKKKGNEKRILPLCHSTQNAQIELTVNETGEFISAIKLEKEETETIIPVTEDSGTRTSGVCPMPFADKLVYIAGDYPKFITGKNSDNSKYFKAYMEQLRKWAESEYSHKAVQAVHSYLKKQELMCDLIGSGVLLADKETGKLSSETKINNIEQESSFVRFRIQYSSDDNCAETWKDTTLYESFIQFNNMNMGDINLCYATGKKSAVTYKHPSKIRNSGDKAKLISSNDENGFTYRGRFSNKEEAISVSYEFSQKFHNALKWLINKQGIHIDTLTLVVWASGMKPVIDNPTTALPDNDEKDTSIHYDSVIGFKKRLQKFLFGYKSEFSSNTKAMIMGLDSATTGRLSIVVYEEINASLYIDNIEKWHEETMWLQFNGKQKKNEYNSFSIKTIAECAFGTEQGDFIRCKNEVIRETTLRLLPCITERRKLPKDIMNALFFKASQPLSYNKDYNFRKVLETACAMIQKYYIDHNYKRGRIYMGYDPNIADRSYLFGCLLAIADKAEAETYEENDKNTRITNAKRYWNVFSQRPAKTWKIIEERLRPYLNKLGSEQVHYTKWINEITNKLTPEMFSNDRLEPLYLLGYHNFNDYMYNGNRNKNTEE